MIARMKVLARSPRRETASRTVLRMTWRAPPVAGDVMVSLPSWSIDEASMVYLSFPRGTRAETGGRRSGSDMTRRSQAPGLRTTIRRLGLREVVDGAIDWIRYQLDSMSDP